MADTRRTDGRAVRWGIVGTANIARAQFLPALGAVGGRAVRVASRSRTAAERFASAHGVEEGAQGYEAVTDATDLDAVYIALPNSMHGEWTNRAIDTGKAVLCEKPLCADVEETRAVIAHAAERRGLLWEAFAFPFHGQLARLRAVIESGDVGPVREIVSAFHFRVSQKTNIRLSRALGGGALADVGCYPIRLAQEILPGGTRPPVAVAGVETMGEEVETDAAVVVDFGPSKLTFSCGFERAYDTFTRVLGETGHVHLTNPYHPGPDDTMAVRRADGVVSVEPATSDEHSFMAMVGHIGAVVRGETAPEHLATETSVGTAELLAMTSAACRR